jgi:serine/threonine protein phosphatase PrpC
LFSFAHSFAEAISEKWDFPQITNKDMHALASFFHISNDNSSLFAALPEVTVHDLSDEWDFIVLGCDGIWDVLTNQAVANFVIESVAEGKYPENICEELLTYCLAPVSSY